MSEKRKEKRTAKQKLKIALYVILIIVLVIGIICGILACDSLLGIKKNKEFIESLEPIKYQEQLSPVTDKDGYYSFVTDKDFKVVQLTDVHIGAGFLCKDKDTKAINAVAAMLTEEKPDLVIVTGDIAYPVPHQAGTLNNKTSAKMFAQLMEQLGVYWTLAFGNHDTEAYSYFSRESIAKVYGSEDYPHCLLQTGPDNVDGYCNSVINVINTKGEIVQSLFTLDSHSYVDGDILGINWKYDCIHENQVKWYEDTLNSLKATNNNVMPKSLAFFHMPLQEYQDAWYEYKNNRFQDTDNVKYKHGEAGEVDIIVYPSNYNYGFFDKALELGSTKGMFCGHDHLNNFSVEYKGIRLTYGLTIDYLAYSDIQDYGRQRGCTVINIAPDGTFDCHQENYYQDKYKSVKEKEMVDMEFYYPTAD